MPLVFVDVLQFFKSKLVCETSIQELVLSLAMNVSYCGASLVLPRLDFAPRSRPCSLEEQYFKCGIFWDYDTAQRHASNSEAPVLAGGVSVFLRGTQFSGASELKEGLVSKCKFI